MYFIELIIKKLTKRKETPIYEPVGDEFNQEPDICEHIFMPIDSTGGVLSCTNCGILIKREELEKSNYNNFFIGK